MWAIKVGKKDIYHLIGSVRSGKETFSLPLKDVRGHSYYKILIEGKFNTANVWYTRETPKSAAN